MNEDDDFMSWIEERSIKPASKAAETKPVAAAKPAVVAKPVAAAKPAVVAKPAAAETNIIQLHPPSIAKSLRHRKSTSTTFLWHPCIIENSVNMIVGAAGTGKSLLATHIIASVTLNGHGAILFAGEDSVEATICPNMEASGADVNRVWLWEDLALVLKAKSFHFASDKDLKLLAGVLQEYNVKLLVFDPIQRFAGIDIMNGQKVGDALVELQRFAARNSVTIIGIIHPTKDVKNVDPISRVAGAKEWATVPRSVYGFYRDPNDVGGTERLLLPIKANSLVDSDVYGYRGRIQTRNIIIDGKSSSRPYLVFDHEPDRSSALDVLRQGFAEQVSKTQTYNVSIMPVKKKIVGILAEAQRPLGLAEVYAKIGKDISSESCRVHLYQMRKTSPPMVDVFAKDGSKYLWYVTDKAHWTRVGVCKCKGRSAECDICGGLGVIWKRKSEP